MHNYEKKTNLSSDILQNCTHVFLLNSPLAMTRLLGPFAPIFCLNYKHFLVVYIIKQNQNLKFSKFNENRFLLEAHF